MVCINYNIADFFLIVPSPTTIIMFGVVAMEFIWVGKSDVVNYINLL